MIVVIANYNSVDDILTGYSRLLTSDIKLILVVIGVWE